MEHIRFVMSSIKSKFFQALHVECSYCLYSALGRAVSKHRKEQGRNNHAHCAKIQQQQKSNAAQLCELGPDADKMSLRQQSPSPEPTVAKLSFLPVFL